MDKPIHIHRFPSSKINKKTTTGAIMRMPGLPKKPAALHIDVVDGKIVGLS